MARRHHQAQRIAAQQLQADALGRALVVAHQADVQFARAQGLELQRRVHLAQVQRHVGMGAAPVGDDVAQHLGERQRGREADAQLAHLAARDALQFLRQRLRGREQLAGADQQRMAGVGQRHGAPRALEQPHAQLGLQRADLLAQWRLRDVQALGRAREVQLLGDGDEIAQVAQLH